MTVTDNRPARNGLVSGQAQAALARDQRAYAERRKEQRRKEAEAADRPILTGQEKARLRRCIDNLVDIEDELLYVVRIDPGLQPVIDGVVAMLVELTDRAYDRRTAPERAEDLEGEESL